MEETEVISTTEDQPALTDRDVIEIQDQAVSTSVFISFLVFAVVVGNAALYAVFQYILKNKRNGQN